MTGTNHALTGAVIALTVKRPELAIPLAFVSHFALDAVPHYNPPKVQKETFKNAADSWAKKLNYPSFIAIFIGDMTLLAIVLLTIPLLPLIDVSGWTVFFSSFAAISPDFVNGRYLIYKILKIKFEPLKKPSLFTQFHMWFQWMERPWGIYVELIWAISMLFIIHKLIT